MIKRKRRKTVVEENNLFNENVERFEIRYTLIAQFENGTLSIYSSPIHLLSH